MAQWNGQFTGNTHLTKVQDLEQSLRRAVIVFREADSSAERLTKEKRVQKLTVKLLTARLKLLKAQLYEAEPVISDDLSEKTKRIETLREQEAKVRAEGVKEILIEFGVKDLILLI